MRYDGKPYLWGGDDPVGGFDCSGLVCEYCKSMGILPRKERLTANGLYWYFQQQYPEVCSHINGAKELPPWGECGDLVFFFWKPDWTTEQRISHVEICLNNYQTIGASGGGSDCIDAQVAIDKNAFIKVRPLRVSNVVAYVRVYDIIMDKWFSKEK